MIVRLPYEAGEPTIAIPAPDPCRSGDDPYLWQTVLWLQAQGVFHPWPEPGTAVLNGLKQELIQGRSETAISEALGVAVFPEAAAEMTGFAKSSRNAPDLYLLVGIGAMTLDACVFRLNPDATKGDLYSFMMAQVRPLGVDSFYWCLEEGKTESEFIRQCERTLHSVVWETKKRRKDPYAEIWKPGNDVPVFLAGGGAANRLHQDVLTSVGTLLKRDLLNAGIRLLELPVPRALELPEPLAHLGRMAVAWGLSYLPTDIGRIHPMRDIEDIPLPVAADIGQQFVSKDHV